MFKYLIAAILVLAGCEAKDTAPARVVTMPESSSTFAKLGHQKNCEWKKKSLSVFGQKNQRLSFDFTSCGDKARIKTWLKDGNTVMLKARGDLTFIYPLITVEKLGPATPEDFLKRKIPQDGFNSGLCDIIEAEPHIWLIVSRWMPDPEKRQDWNSDANPCGKFPSQEAENAFLDHPPEYGMGDVYVIKEGIVFTIGNLAGLNVKVNSIIYESRG